MQFTSFLSIRICRLLKFTSKEDNNIIIRIAESKYHGFWWSSIAVSQVISNYDN